MALEHENAKLKEELAFHRVNPQTPLHATERQVQELTLTLRRLSEKLDLTERALLERTSELTHARSDLVKARHEADAAYELASLLRSREEEGKARERTLQAKARASEEERNMVDLVVQEYADLVRSLEGRKSANIANPTRVVSTATLTNDLNDNKAALQKLFAEFTEKIGILETTISDLQDQVSFVQAALDAERKTSVHDRTLLSQAQAELDRLKLDDQTAAKMVTRYMYVFRFIHGLQNDGSFMMQEVFPILHQRPSSTDPRSSRSTCCHSIHSPTATFADGISTCI